MAREGVSYEQVKAAAEELIGEAREPSIRAVREQLRGTGSPNTIHRHLTRWREARPEALAATTQLPSSIFREINAEIQRSAFAARAEVAAQLAQAKTEAADLAATGEALEAERDALAEQLAAMIGERAGLAGKAAEQGAEIERFGQALDRERRAAEAARIELALGTLKFEAQSAQLNDQRTSFENCGQELRSEQQAHHAAERELAAVSAARDGLGERLADLHGREQFALREVSELRTRADQYAEAARAAAGDVARLQEAVTREHQDADGLRTQTLDLRRELNACSIENVRLSGLLGREATASAPTRSKQGG